MLATQVGATRTILLWATVAVVTVTGSLSAQVFPGQQARDSQVASTDPSTALIMGTVVVAGTGLPADGVRVTLSGGGIRVSRSTLTDDDGRFAFLALPAGTFTLRGAKTGYVSATYGQKAPGRPGTPIVLAAGQQLKDVSLDLPKGGVIAGVIYDEKNRPSVSIPVRVLRWTMQTGERTLLSSGTANTDDRGMYRVFGLSPGQYVVSAVPRNTSTTIVTSEDLQSLGVMQDVLRAEALQLELLASGRAGQPGAFAVDLSDLAGANTPKEPVSGYAPVYYPGTAQPDTAREITLGASEEQLGIDFQLQRVALSRVVGQVMTPPGVTTSSVRLRLLSRGQLAPGVQTLSATAKRDGTFAFAAVPPGQYDLIATASVSRPRPQLNVGMAPAEMERAGATKLWATADVFVGGGFQPDLMLTMQSGMTVSGALTFAGAAALPSNLQRVRVTLGPYGKAMSAAGVGSTNANADENGRFTFQGIVPGRYRVRASGASGWSLKTVMVEGQDVLDFWLEVTPGEDVSNVTVGFGDAVTDLKGTLQSQLGEPTADYTVIIFPSDRKYWVPLARRMRSTRPSTDGRFGFTGLPPGDYRLATVTDVEPGAWFDPALLEQLQAASVAVRLIEGQPVVQDLRVSR